MSVSTVSVWLGGLLSLAVGLLHLSFPRIFRWDIDMRRASDLNVRVFDTLHVALYLLLFLFAYLAFFYNRELAAAQGLAGGITAGYALFWLWRTVRQLAFFRVGIAWQKGSDRKMAERDWMHWVLAVVFALLAVTWALPPLLSILGPR